MGTVAAEGELGADGLERGDEDEDPDDEVEDELGGRPENRGAGGERGGDGGREDPVRDQESGDERVDGRGLGASLGGEVSGLDELGLGLDASEVGLAEAAGARGGDGGRRESERRLLDGSGGVGVLDAASAVGEGLAFFSLERARVRSQSRRTWGLGREAMRIGYYTRVRVRNLSMCRRGSWGRSGIRGGNYGGVRGGKFRERGDGAVPVPERGYPCIRSHKILTHSDTRKARLSSGLSLATRSHDAQVLDLDGQRPSDWTLAHRLASA